MKVNRSNALSAKNFVDKMQTWIRRMPLTKFLKLDDNLEMEGRPKTNWLPTMFSGIGDSLRRLMPDRRTLRVLIVFVIVKALPL